MHRLATNHRFLLAACVLSLLAAGLPIAIGAVQLVQIEGEIGQIHETDEAVTRAHHVMKSFTRSLPDFMALATDLGERERRMVSARATINLRRLRTDLDRFLEIAPQFATPNEITEIEQAAADIQHGWEEIAVWGKSSTDLSRTEKTFHILRLVSALEKLQANMGVVERRTSESHTSAVDGAFEGVRQSQWLLLAALCGAAMIGAVAVYTNFRSARQMRRANAELTSNRDRLQDMVDEATLEIKLKAVALEQALGKEQELNMLQRQFVTMASHEFRTPLAIIDGAAQRLKRRLDVLSPDDVVAATKKIQDAVRRVVQLMESTLMAERLHDGTIEIDVGSCDIADTVRQVCERQQEISPAHTISCRLDDLPATIRADTAAINQVLTNLLSNAVKYAPDAPEIDVVARGNGDEVVVSVADNGLGIDEDELPRMFTRYFRARTSSGIAGTGIGLNLSMMLVRRHGGTMTVESRKGEGSTFTVRLPVGGPTETAAELSDAA